MLSLSAVVAIAASGAAFFIVVGVVGIVVWVRVRKERHALKVLGLKQGPNRRGIRTFTGHTLTELSHAEGTALRAHGQLPYGKPTEWGQLASRETLLQPKSGSDALFPLMDKARSIRNSISRSRSKRLSRTSHKRMSSMATVSETATHQFASPPRPSDSREDIPLSAVEGVLELPAERTPRQTPEIGQEEDNGFHLGMRPVSPAWPLPSQKDRSGLFPVFEDCNSPDSFDPAPQVFEESPRRIRGTSIASQTPGTVPNQPIPAPPPPTAYPPDRFSYLRNDSVMRLSSMSLDTTNSSILDDGVNGPRSADTELTSPIFPSGTFVPFSANDVGVKNGRRSFIADNSSLPPLHNFPVRSSSTAETRRRSSLEPMTSPRRSLTTTSRNPSNASDKYVGPPRRSESLPSNPPQRHASLRGGTPVSINGVYNVKSLARKSSGSQMVYVPHFSQFQRPMMYEGEQNENDPFYGGSPNSTGTLFSMGSPGQMPVSSVSPSPTMQRSSLSLRGGHLPSAMKGSKPQRKGHRRQNCVRISIHPPMTFGGPAFSPTVEEEPEDLDAIEELDLRESAINGPLKSLPSLSDNTISSLPLSKRTSRRNKPPPSNLGPLAEEPHSLYNRSPSKKRQKTPDDTAETNSLFDKNRALPELFTSLPATTDGSLSHTPSPQHPPPVWSIPEAPSPSTFEQSPGAGSPRRSNVKGPRSQPGRPVRSSSTRAPPPKPIESLMGAGSPSRLPLITGTQGSDWRKSTDSLHRTNTDPADRSYRRYRDSQGSLASMMAQSNIPSSPPYGAKGGSTVKDRVTIWEDANRGGSPPKPPAAQLAGYSFPDSTSPAQARNSIPRTLHHAEFSPTRMSSQRMPPTPTSARRGMATPNKPGLGLGIGCTGTPASLYDGDGFLRE
ncbi:uncharacterized protein N7459_007883 [Penicillium hispanicum]|uniref:uncharacterized protein n=1 Tax=Penicillium hispanicum TaxID=1080232 RepID=UPI0025402992|nr:uncharacterized protein N7459_007883 [Penicillium hispanicum]KAJ5573456.1 hypothetical protein N7459_007883 [Penicillium hispanicum]